VRYARIDTQSDAASTTYPSTEKQLDLSRLLVDELHDLGLEVELDPHGYVLATVPATADGDVPTIGLIAHVDVSPAAPSADVRPQRLVYEGGDLALPGDPSVVLGPSTDDDVADHVGHELVTSDGRTLLGADDKGGVAEIMAAVAYLVRHPEVPHGRIRIAFTPDEEVGEGTTHLDLDHFGADYAYTLDGSGAGEIEDETFGALEAKVTFHGVSTHPGTAKGKLVSAVRAAGIFVESFPRDRLSPETTEDREGYLHPESISGSTESCTVTVILRDHDEDLLAEHEALMRRLADAAAAAIPGARVEIAMKRQYRNMKEYLRDHPQVVAAAEEAIRRAGLEPLRTIIRGGTDGARLSERGLPTPNLFTGGHAYHSRREWICVPDMGSAAETILHLVQVWVDAAHDEQQLDRRAASG
jgi:tripeptide aminopeptidase